MEVSFIICEVVIDWFSSIEKQTSKASTVDEDANLQCTSNAIKKPRKHFPVVEEKKRTLTTSTSFAIAVVNSATTIRSYDDALRLVKGSADTKQATDYCKVTDVPLHS